MLRECVGTDPAQYTMPSLKKKKKKYLKLKNRSFKTILSSAASYYILFKSLVFHNIFS